ncbi:MAG: bifunctional demethylmenaquinone methyltransferase/2-methoxy-6-polyprenyl-1,4-benzoquinol methylase UbiE [Polyangiaceae bacterium]|nr:bifunctional demethylmenaquinone methyltransferase/2-methoxy-6-polyprenyl-1,4-benzoquinol methylase UbiE [Polyangiaceae bacterium]
MTGAVPRPAAGSGAMFDRIAGRYDLINRVISLGTDQAWRRRTVEALALVEDARVLDLATGTGDLAIAVALRHPTAMVVGIDPSEGMLTIGMLKVRKAGLGSRVELSTGDAQALTFAAGSFDAVCMAFGIRNIPDRGRALREIRRVLRPGGRAAILELSEPKGVLGPLARFHVHRVVPWIGGRLSRAPEYRYLERSIAQFPPATGFASEFAAAGFTVAAVSPMSCGVVHLYVGIAENHE